MPALWAYPWTLHREGLDDACERVTECGIDALNVAGHYHSVRTMEPRFPDELFRAYEGGCYFDPGDRFDDESIAPPVNRVGSWDDPFAEIADGARECGLDVNAWMVCLHNTRLGSTNPDYRIESAFGDAHDHTLCPSHPEVRAYLAAVIGAFRDRGVDEIHLESIGFPTVFHSHGPQFGHDKRQAASTTADAALLSQCFCDGCRAAADSHRVDIDAAEILVQEHLKRSFATPATSPSSMVALVEREPVIADLLDFRASVVDRLLETMSDAAGATPLNYYALESYGSSIQDLALAGVRPDILGDHLDRITALCYVADPATARKRITTLDRNIDLPVDAGLTLAPDVVDGPGQLEDLVDGIRSVTDGSISFYHHSLATRTHLKWIANALQ